MWENSVLENSKKLKTEYLEAKRVAEDVKDKVEKIQVTILEKYPFYESDEILEMIAKRFPEEEHKRERILKVSNAFDMSKDDFQKFLDLTYEEYKKAGIDDPRGRDWCPEAIPQKKNVCC